MTETGITGTRRTETPSCGWAKAACGDGPESATLAGLSLEGTVQTPSGRVPRVPAALNSRDRLGAFKVRWGIRRMKFTVRPGLYGVGNPDGGSPVLVSANYKLSFDSLRRELVGRDAWILVLDTKGINVWCAAGKGTFGTEEVIRQVTETGLSRVVSHRKLVLPQLGAPGVAAHEVQNRTGFRVVYGPVRAADLGRFLDNRMTATPEMRRVKFGLRERAILVPEEVVPALPMFGILAAVVAALDFLGAGRLIGLDFIGLAGAVLAGSAVVPLLLPWIPGRAFSFKGWLVGLTWTLLLYAFASGLPGYEFSWGRGAAGLLLWPAVSAYVAMNFTGSSTFTSLSGVVKEMRRGVPLMIASASLSLVMFILAGLIKF